MEPLEAGERVRGQSPDLVVRQRKDLEAGEVFKHDGLNFALDLVVAEVKGHQVGHADEATEFAATVHLYVVSRDVE